MILDFSNFKESEEENTKVEITNAKNRKKKELEYFMKIKRNIIDLFLFDNDLLTDGKILPKSFSEPNLKKMKKHNKSKNNNIPQAKKEKNFTNLNIQEEENKKNRETKDRIINNKKKIKNNNIECNIYIYDNFENNEKNQNYQHNIQNKDNLEKNSENDDLNIKKNHSNNDMNIIENNNDFNNNKNKINASSPQNQIEDNSSHNSSKNYNKLKKDKNQRTSFYSSSSLGRNFILKNKVCKSTNNEHKIYKNSTNSDENPLMAYYMGKNLANFYLVTDKKSQEEIDGMQFMNFFPMNEKELKCKDKDIMSCIYIDNKVPKFQEEKNKKKNQEKKNNYEQNDIFNFNNNFNKDNNTIQEEKYELENLNLNDNNNDIIKEDNNMNFGDYMNNNNNYINEGNKNNMNENDNNSVKINNNINNKNVNNKIPIEKNNFLNLNNNLSYEDKQNIINKLPLKNEIDLKEENFEFPMSKKNEKNDFLNNYFDKNIINNLNLNEDNNIKLPLSFENIPFNLDDTNLKEFKLNKEILDEISNLNKNIKLDPNFFKPSENLKFPDSYSNSINNQNNNNEFNLNNNEFNLNNININDININYNLNNLNFNKNDFNMNNYNENLNYMNMLPYNKSFYEYTEEELLKYAIPLIKDQSGCRFLQEKIKTNQYFANDKLFPEIKYNIKELGCDPFGNYFLQVLIEVLSYENVNLFLDLIQKDFTSVCICPHGTRVIQKIIEKIALMPDLMTKFIKNLNTKDLGIICKSAYGNHIMQKFLMTIHNPEYTKFIYDYTYNNFMEIAETKHGVCVIQKCVSEGDQNQRKILYDLILKNFETLIKDQFANYLIQYILINTKTQEKLLETMPLLKKIEENLLNYCKSKFSANVIEKCFENNENYIREHILEYLLTHYKDNIIEILLDQYGIYIIQKALKFNSFYKRRLCDIINQKESELRNININEFKYRGILKIINSNKELGMIFNKAKENNNNGYNNQINYNNNHYNNEGEHRNNNRGKNKRGRKHYRGNNGNY